MNQKFDLYYWVARFNQCTSDAMYEQVSQEYDQAIALLNPTERATAEQGFQAYTLRRLERLDKSMAILDETMQDYVSMQNSLLMH